MQGPWNDLSGTRRSKTLTDPQRLEPGDPEGVDDQDLAWPMTSRMVDHCRRGVEQLGSSLGS
jgi:hypothetical protein